MIVIKINRKPDLFAVWGIPKTSSNVVSCRELEIPFNLSEKRPFLCMKEVECFPRGRARGERNKVVKI